MDFVWCLGLLFSFESLIQNGFTVSIIDPKLDFIEAKRSEIVSKSPKIQGLRIIVDTTKIKESDELKNDEDEISREKGSKSIGVRTDITFEIDNDRNDSTSVSDEKLKNIETTNEDDNASVPIFKGIKISPNERKDSESNDNDDDIRLYNVNNIHWRYYYQRNKDVGLVFHSTDDENFRRGIDSYPNFIPPAGLWTTERNFLSPGNTDGVRYYKNPEFNKPRQPIITTESWKPCYCDESQSFHSSTTNTINKSRQNYGIDTKLDAP